MNPENMDNTIHNQNTNERITVLDPKVVYYFNQLENLGDFTLNDPNKTLDRVNVGLVKVGARPVSGIRGLYFSKGMWKVKFFDNDLEVVTCLFRYTDRETLIDSYHSARKFLKKVIEYRRQIHEDDGTILEELNDQQLVDLDERKSRKLFLLDNTPTYDKTTNRYIDAKVLENFSLKRARMNSRVDFRKSPDSDKEIIRKKKKVLKQMSDNNQTIQSNGPGRKKVKERKLSRFEENFLKYSDCSTIKMINKIIEENRQIRLKEDGKTYTVKNRFETINRVLEDNYVKMFGNDYYLSNLESECCLDSEIVI